MLNEREGGGGVNEGNDCVADTAQQALLGAAPEDKGKGKGNPWLRRS